MVLPVLYPVTCSSNDIFSLFPPNPVPRQLMILEPFFTFDTASLNLEFIYKYYSKIIPHIGKAIVGKKEPYEYLTKSTVSYTHLTLPTNREV